MIRAVNKKMIVVTKDQGYRHGDRQQEQAQAFLRGPQQIQSKQRAEQNHGNDEEHAGRRQGHVEFLVRGAVNDVD